MRRLLIRMRKLLMGIQREDTQRLILFIVYNACRRPGRVRWKSYGIFLRFACLVAFTLLGVIHRVNNTVLFSLWRHLFLLSWRLKSVVEKSRLFKLFSFRFVMCTITMKRLLNTVVFKCIKTAMLVLLHCFEEKTMHFQ